MQKATSREYCFDKVGNSTLFFCVCLYFCLEVQVASLNGTGTGCVDISTQIYALVNWRKVYIDQT